MLRRKSKSADKAAKKKTKPKKEKAPKARTGAGVPVARAKPDVYTAMLAIALAAILLACLFLVLEMNRYDFDLKGSNAGLPGVEFLADARTLPNSTV